MVILFVLNTYGSVETANEKQHYRYKIHSKFSLISIYRRVKSGNKIQISIETKAF